MQYSGGDFDDWMQNSRQPIGLGLSASFGLVAGVVLFSSAPHIDLTVANLFFDARLGAFLGKGASVEIARNAFKLLYVGVFAFAAIGLANSWINGSRFLDLRTSKWLFMCLCLSVGPGLVSNVMLKDQWGRARPNQIIEFGGKRLFTPAPTPATQCERNCSFVSGEASSVYMVFFAGALAFRRWSRRLLAAGLIGGSLAGLIRIAQGGHFLSDVYFACVAMAITASLLHLFFRHLTREVQRAEAATAGMPA